MISLQSQPIITLIYLQSKYLQGLNMHAHAKALIFGLFCFVLVSTITIEVDYQKHQRSMTYSELTLEQKGEHHRISSLIMAIQRASAQEDNERFLAYKLRGEFKDTKKPLMFNSEYQTLVKQLQDLMNPTSRKTEGYGYQIYKFLGVVS